MAGYKDITVEYVTQLLDYNSETGVLIWKPRTPDMFKDGNRRSAKAECQRWNKIYAGTRAGTLRSGYLRIRIDKYRPQAHHIVWLIVYGEWPKNQLDHRNGKRAFNKINNLREAKNDKEQSQNRRKRSDNTSGFTGVYWNGFSWRAEVQITIDGNRVRISQSFKDKIKAREFYLDMKKQYHEFQPIPRRDA